MTKISVPRSTKYQLKGISSSGPYRFRTH